MAEATSTTVQIQNWLDLLRAGDERARNALIEHAYERLRKLARSHLRGFSPLKARGEVTDSVLNDVVVRLERALEEVKPDSPRQFFGLASQHIRWALLDLKKRGKRELAMGQEKSGASPPEAVDSTAGPATRAEKRDFVEDLHTKVQDLPDELREVVDLLFYQDLTQEEAADVLGISVRTIGRKWRKARLVLAGDLNLDCELEDES
jgi:RNA polymerase sigma factor (sigma-70 family)